MLDSAKNDSLCDAHNSIGGSYIVLGRYSSQGGFGEILQLLKDRLFVETLGHLEFTRDTTVSIFTDGLVRGHDISATSGLSKPLILVILVERQSAEQFVAGMIPCSPSVRKETAA